MRLLLFAAIICSFNDLNAQSLSVTLTASDHNGYNISCFGGRDGSIQALVSGGTAPYHYRWLHGDTTSTVSDLSAGYYKLTVTDATLDSWRKALITCVVQ